MGSSAAHRQAMWDREKAERKPIAKLEHEPPKRRTYNLRAAAKYGVAKVYDDGRLPHVVKARLMFDEAETAAGRMRDGMSDEECGRALEEGWNYMRITLAGPNKAKVANPDDKAVQASPGGDRFPLRKVTP